MFKSDKALQKKSLIEELVNIMIPDWIILRVFQRVSRRRRVVLRRGMAVGMIGLFAAAVSLGGNAVLHIKTQTSGTIVISPQEETKNEKELTLIKNQLSSPSPEQMDTQQILTEDTKAGEEKLAVSVLPTPFALTTTNEEVLQRSAVGSLSEMKEPEFVIPDHLSPNNSVSSKVSQVGKIKTRFIADWTQLETPIIWANFSGNSKANLFEISGNGQMLSFNNYDADGNLADTVQVQLDNDYKGREYTIEARWDFEKFPGVKEIAVDGIAAGYEELNFIPHLNQDSQTYAWLVEEINISN